MGCVCDVDVFLVPNVGKEGLRGEHFSPAWLVQEVPTPEEGEEQEEATMIVNKREVARNLGP